MYEKIFSLRTVILAVGGLAIGLATAPGPGAVLNQNAFQEDAVATRIGELRDEDPRVRRHAAWALGELESDASLEALHGSLRDNNADVRLVAAWALGEIKALDSVDRLSEILQDDDPLVREMAVLALGEIEHSSAIPAVLEAAERHADLRGPAVWALGEIGGARAEEARSALLAEMGLPRRENDEVWSGHLGDPGSISRDVPVLIAALRDQDPAMRRSAAEWLGRIGDPQAVDPLLDSLRDSDPRVRAMAVWALDEINPSRDAEQPHEPTLEHEGSEREEAYPHRLGVRV